MTESPFASDLAHLRTKIEEQLRGNDEGFHGPAAAVATDVLRWYQPLKWTTPANVDQLRNEVSQAVYNGSSPRIIAHYQSAPAHEELNAAAKGIERVLPQIRNHFAALELQSKADELRGLATALGSESDDDFGKWAVRTYGVPTTDTLREAENIRLATKEDEPDDGPTIDDQALAALLQQGLDLYGLDHWRIEPAPILAKVSVNGLDNLIRVQRGLLVSPQEAQRLLAHEIGRHVLSMENASHQPDPFARLSLGRQQLATEEGLASWLETYILGSSNSARYQVFAARALASSWIQEFGVVEIARRLADTLPVAEAVSVAIRVKRGTREMSGPGGSTKDHQYLTGLLRIHNHLIEHPGDLQKIQSTKWSLAQLPEVERRLGTGQLLPAVYDVERLREVSISYMRPATSGRSIRTVGMRWFHRLRRS